MKTTTNINKVIDDFNSLVLEEQEFAIDIIKKVYAEANREQILKTSKKAVENYKKGNVKRGDLTDLYNDLEND